MDDRGKQTKLPVWRILLLIRRQLSSRDEIIWFYHFVAAMLLEVKVQKGRTCIFKIIMDKESLNKRMLSTTLVLYLSNLHHQGLALPPRVWFGFTKGDKGGCGGAAESEQFNGSYCRVLGWNHMQERPALDCDSHFPIRTYETFIFRIKTQWVHMTNA